MSGDSAERPKLEEIKIQRFRNTYFAEHKRYLYSVLLESLWNPKPSPHRRFSISTFICDCYGSCSCRIVFKLCESDHPIGTTFPERFSTIGWVLLLLSWKNYQISGSGVENWGVWCRKIENRSILSSCSELWVAVSPSSDGVTHQTWLFLILESVYLNV